MAIEDILNALEDQASADCAECLDEAKAHAEHILSTSREEADTIKARHVLQVERAAQAKAAQRVNAARLEGKMLVSSVKGEGLESVFDDARSQLGSLRQSPSYPALLSELLDEALADASGTVTVRVNPGDVEAARQKLASRGLDGDVVGDESITGGALVELSAGRILRRNTFEDRLERVRGVVQNDVAKVLLA